MCGIYLLELGLKNSVLEVIDDVLNLEKLKKLTIKDTLEAFSLPMELLRKKISDLSGLDPIVYSLLLEEIITLTRKVETAIGTARAEGGDRGEYDQ